MPYAVVLCSLRGQVVPVLLRRRSRAAPRRRETVSCIEMRITTAFCQVVPQQRFHKLGNKNEKKIKDNVLLMWQKMKYFFNLKPVVYKVQLYKMLCYLPLYARCISPLK